MRLAPLRTAVVVGCALAFVACQSVAVDPLILPPPACELLVGGSVERSAPTKVDLLFAIDNAPSMVDAQRELARRVPALLRALVAPATVDDVTPRPIVDLHVGVISTSLGAFGTDACDESPAGNEVDDHAHLLPRAGEANGAGFSDDPTSGAPTVTTCPAPTVASALTWTFDPMAEPAGALTGSSGALTLQAATSCVVESVGEKGCQYPAGLESIYRFLIDPAPYQSAQSTCTPVDGGVQCDDIQVNGVDAELLRERASFLRPDSILAVVLVTNKNDASLKPAGADWVFPGLPGGAPGHVGAMPRGWAACAALPDDFEVEDYTQIEARGCFWCDTNPADPNCDPSSWIAPGSHDFDQRSLRMFEQTRRFGVNGLFARDRYVNGFTQAQVVGSDGEPGANGIFAGGQRTADLVVFAVIAGVPEVLVTDSASGAVKDLAESDWEKVVDPDRTIRDPHMIESIEPRAGVPTFVPSATPSVAAIPTDFADPINGGDRAVPNGDDLQYACLGVRASATLDPIAPDCDATAQTDETNPLCGQGGASQPRLKAYPSLRPLRVLHEIERTGAGVGVVAASVCAQSYAPAMDAIAAQLRLAIDQPCERLQLTPDPTTNDVPCVVEKVFATNVVGGVADPPGACELLGTGLCTPGSAPCRRVGGDAAGFTVVPTDVAASQICASLPYAVGSTGAPYVTPNGNVAVDLVDATGARTQRLVCEGLPLTDGRAGVTPDVTDGCVNDPDFTLPSGLDGGWCYSTNPAVIGGACTKRGSAGTLRYLGLDRPVDGTLAFAVCSQ